ASLPLTFSGPAAVNFSGLAPNLANGLKIAGTTVFDGSQNLTVGGTSTLQGAVTAGGVGGNLTIDTSGNISTNGGLTSTFLQCTGLTSLTGDLQILHNASNVFDVDHTTGNTVIAGTLACGALAP